MVLNMEIGLKFDDEEFNPVKSVEYGELQEKCMKYEEQEMDRRIDDMGLDLD